MHNHAEEVGRGRGVGSVARSLLALGLTVLLLPGLALGGERNFIVMLAHSVKSADGEPHPQGEFNPMNTNFIREAYFDDEDPTITSFKEFWEEISYCDVIINGALFDYAYLPWPYEAPDDVLDENNPDFSDGTVPFTDLNNSHTFSYGGGEPFNEGEQMFEVDWDGNFNGPVPPGLDPTADDDDGEATDIVNDGLQFVGSSFAKIGLVDGVWTPGERFRDLDGDERWDVAELGPDGICPTPDEQGDNGWLFFTDPDNRDNLGIAYDPRFATLGEGDPPPVEFCDLDGDQVFDPGEPWEDFLVRYDPTQPEGFRWVRVTATYLRNNYPGDVDTLLRRTGNFTWDGPDWWEDFRPDGASDGLGVDATTKLQHNGLFVPARTTPRPRWLSAMWQDRYGNTPPAWDFGEPGGENIPEIIPFNPTEPDPAVEEDRTGEELERVFDPTENVLVNSLYGQSGNNRGFNAANEETNEDPDSDTGDVQPDATGVYDGPVEFDDMASSIYHDPPDVAGRFRFTNGDLRLGEMTFPDLPDDDADSDVLQDIYGKDISQYDPYDDLIGSVVADNRIWSAGPYAFRIHGDNNMDAGNQLNIELLTWRTDGRGAATPKPEKLPLLSFWSIPGNHDLYLGQEETFSDDDGSGGYSYAEDCLDPLQAPPEECSTGCFGIRSLAVDDNGRFYIANVYDSTISVVQDCITNPADCEAGVYPADCGAQEPEHDPATTTVLVDLRSYGMFDVRSITFGPDGYLYALDANTDNRENGDKIAVINIVNPDAGIADVLAVHDIDPPGRNRHVTSIAFDPGDGTLWAIENANYAYGIINQTTWAWSTRGSLSDPPNPPMFGLVQGVAFNPADGTFWGVTDDRRFIQIDTSVTPNAGSTVGGGFAGPTRLFDITFDSAGTAYGSNVNHDDNKAGSLADIHLPSNTYFNLFLVQLTGNGICADFEDLDDDGEWDRWDEPWIENNTNCRYDFAGFRDFNLDGLIDQGETVVPGAMNYLNDPFPSTPNDGVHGVYPFNRRRLNEDVVEVNDHEVNWADLVTGGQLPGVIYSVTLVNPFDNPFGDVPEFSPSLRPIHTRDQGEPFTDDNGNEEWDPGEGFTDVNGNGKRDFGQPISITDLVGPPGPRGTTPAPDYRAAVNAHEYGHFWENWPDLYDPTGGPSPVGGWDLMSNAGQFPHPGPVLKRLDGGSVWSDGITHAPWIQPIDLESILTPGVPTDVTIDTCEISENRNSAYYVYTNPDHSGERFFLWRVTNSGINLPNCRDPQIVQPTTHRNLPGSGVLIMHVDTGDDPDARPQQQPSVNYRLIQADGNGDLENGVNTGDPGDPFTAGQTWDEDTFIDDKQNSRWNNGAISGLSILDIDHQGDKSIVTFLWIPQDVPTFSFVRPPGGSTTPQGVYNIEYRASDRFGGTLIEFYIDGPYDSVDAPDGNPDINGPNAALLCASLGVDDAAEEPRDCGASDAESQIPKPPGTTDTNFPVDVSNLDGDYFFFARLIPGPGSGGTEQASSVPRPGSGNRGDGTMTQPVVDLTASMAELWTVRCINDTELNHEEWVVEGTESGVQSFKAFTGDQYVSDDGQVRFTINPGSTPFQVEDRFFFQTTGKTPFSARLRVNQGVVPAKPVPFFTANPPGGGVPAAPWFDARASFDPASGTGDTLIYRWDFDGDGTFELEGQEWAQVNIPGGPIDYQYTTAGQFIAKLTVASTIPPGLSSVNPYSVEINIQSNDPPDPCVQDTDPQGTPFEGNTDETSGGFVLRVRAIPCPGQDTIDPNQDPVVAQWDFGDPYDQTCDVGCTGQTGDCTLTAEQVDDGLEVCHTYRAEGSYVLTLTAQEDTVNAQPGAAVQPVTVHGNGAPSAIISADPIGGPTSPTPLTVNFNGSGSSDPNEPIQDLTFEWDFGDSSAVNSGTGLAAVSHDYTTDAPTPPGYYTAQLTVTDSLGVSDTATKQIFAGNQLPTANISTNPSPPVVFEEETITFNGSGSSDPDGDSLTFLWNFGDGNTSTDEVAQHAYANEGAYNVTLTVSDGKGPTDTDTIAVTVNRNDPPIAKINANPESGGPPLEVSFSAIGSEDRETSVAALVYTWDFGDLTGKTQGVGLTSIKHTYNVSGTYTASLTVSDGVFVATDSVTITVRVPPPSAPTAALTANPASGAAPLTVVFDASGSTDPDDDLATFLWEFGDPSIARESLASVTQLTHTYETEGTYTARLTAFDMRGQSTTKTVEIVVGEGGATAPVPAAPCGLGAVSTMSLTFLGLIGMKRRARRKPKHR